VRQPPPAEQKSEDGRVLRETISRCRSWLADRFGSKQLNIRIEDCRHYCGFRYAAGSLNPYEAYVAGLHAGREPEELRSQFDDFLVHFRPQSFGELLQIPLPDRIPFWRYPWHEETTVPSGWIEDVEAVPDILTYYSPAGIKRSKLDEEYSWLEQAYASITTNGYLPERYAFIDVFELKDSGRSVFIVKDGNHRLSVLSVLGIRDVQVKRRRRAVADLSQIASWPQVVSGLYSPEEAEALFRAYFRGVNDPKRSDQPATILER
jgi:hypothetical protein